MQTQPTYPAYFNGLTIEVLDGRHCVTLGFGGRIVNTCIDLEDALEMRERAAIGVPAEVVQLTALLDAHKNRAHAATVAIRAEAGYEPHRFYGDSNRVTYMVGGLYADAWRTEDAPEALALERLLDQVRYVAAPLMQVAAE